MTWMLTASGETFNLQFIAQEDISIETIAHHLSQINRYCGAAARPISVAEHSLLVSEILERELGVRSPSVLLAGLMHDAHEAYIGDVSSPMKQMLGLSTHAWHHLEVTAQLAVLRRFRLLTPFHADHKRIEEADRIALATERRDLMPACGPDWPVLKDIRAVEWRRLPQVEMFTWRDWRQAFLDRYAELDYARQLQVQDLGRNDTPANDAGNTEEAAA